VSKHHIRLACRLHAVLCELTPGGLAGEISAAQATRLIDELEPAGAVAAARHAVAVELVGDLRRLDGQRRDTNKGSPPPSRRRHPVVPWAMPSALKKWSSSGAIGPRTTIRLRASRPCAVAAPT
jgi:hypothetical protein